MHTMHSFATCATGSHQPSEPPQAVVGKIFGDLSRNFRAGHRIDRHHRSNRNTTPECLDSVDLPEKPWCGPGAGLARAPLATAAALATMEVAAHGSSIAALQSSLTTGLSNKADQSAFDVLEGVVATKSTPDGVDLKLSNYSTTAAMNGSIASANNATPATVAANYGLKTVVDQHSLDRSKYHAAGGRDQGGQRSPGRRVSLVGNPLKAQTKHQYQEWSVPQRASSCLGSC